MAALKAKNSGTAVLVEVQNLKQHIDVINQQYVIEIVNENEFLVQLTTKRRNSTLLSFLLSKNIEVYKIQPQGGLEEWFIDLTKQVKTL